MKITNFAVVIELERHIEILLLKNDCVIVPGLGGFVASHVVARYDDNDGMFIPPLRTLGFNPKLKVNDSLLVQSYSDAYDISFPDAIARIGEEVDELRQQIENAGAYELNNIGTLYLNGDGNISFKPFEAGILTPGLYGLSTFEMKMRTNARVGGTKAESSETPKVPFTVMPVSDGISADEVTDTNAPHVVSGNERSIQIKVSVIRNLVAAVVAVLLFLCLGTPVNEYSGTMSMSGIDNGVVDKLINDGYNNIVRKTEGVTLKSSGESGSLDSANSKPEAVCAVGKGYNKGMKDTITCKNYFCIVLASQVTKKNASAFVERLEAGGFGKARMLVEKNKSVKVVYGRYETQKDAYNELNDLRGNENFYEAWVYQVKN